MTHSPHHDLIDRTADLLCSLQDSILRLRHEAEALREQLAAEGEIAGSGQPMPQLTRLEGLVRDCQKVEKALVAQSSQFTNLAQSAAVFDLDAARAEITRRLSGLRDACDDGSVSG